MADINLTIDATTKEAEKAFRQFAFSGQKALKSVESSFNLVKAAAVGVAAIFAGRQVISGISAVTDAASVQEDAIKQLNTALALAGDFSEEASQSMQDFASDLQNASTIGDETSLSMLALAKSFGVSNEQAQDLVQAAADLSAATGISLESAVRNLGKTFGGLTGELGEVVPALKDLSKEALESGEAVDFVLKRFGGAAQSQVATFSGATKQLSNTFGDFLEEIGFAITQNPVLIDAIRKAQEIFSGLIDTIKENRDEISTYVSRGLKAIIGTAPFVIRSFQIMADGLSSLATAFAASRFAIADWLAEANDVGFLGQNIVEGLELIPVGLARIAKELTLLISQSPALQKFAEFLGIDLLEAFKAIENFELKAATDIGFDVDNSGLEEIKQEAVDLANSVSSIFDPIDSGFDVAIEAANELNEAIQKLPSTGAQSFDNLKKVSQNASRTIQDDFKFFEDLGFDNLGAQLQDTVALPPPDPGFFVEAMAFAARTAREIWEGITFDNVVSAFDTGVQIFRTAFSGDLFNSLTNAINSIGTLPAEIRESFFTLINTLNTVIEELPAIVQDIVTLFPSFARGFADQFPKLIDGLVEAFPQIANAIAEAAPFILQAILDGIPELIRVIPQIVDEFAKALPGLVDQIADALPEIIAALAEAAPLIVRSLVDAIPGIVEAIAENADEIAVALAEGLIEASGDIAVGLVESLLFEGGLERIGGAIIRGMIRSVGALAQSFMEFLTPGFKVIGQEFTNVIKGAFGEGAMALVNGLKNTFDNFFKALKDPANALGLPPLPELKVPEITLPEITVPEPAWLQRLLDAIAALDPTSNISNAQSNIEGFFQDPGGTISRELGFGAAEGLMVPPGFPNDSFNARLTSGELVTPPEETKNLFSLINRLANGGGNNQAGGQMVVQLMVGERQLADVILDLNRQGFRTA